MLNVLVCPFGVTAAAWARRVYRPQRGGRQDHRHRRGGDGREAQREGMARLPRLAFSRC